MTEKHRYLVTTADERTWKFDRPIIFLGEWCRFYDRKDVWSQMDAVVAETYGLGAGQKEQDIARVQALSQELLIELTDALNAYHNTDHGSRYWNIVLGHWLQRYVKVTFNRYFTLELALKNHEFSGTTVLDSSDYSLATNDSMTFVWACNNSFWNHVLYSRILDFWGVPDMNVDRVPLRGIGGFVQENGWTTAPIGGFKGSIKNAVRYILPILSKKRDALIVKSYLPALQAIKWQLSLGQCPQLWRSPPPKEVASAPEKRRHFHIAAEGHGGFERFVRIQLSEVIPTCYLEGYGEVSKQADYLPWPREPRFIFTSNNFDTDEVFKFWTGSKVERGVPYFVGQHGNYQASRGHANWPEVVTCDKFLTWGWTNRSPKNIPAFALKTAGRPLRGGAPNGGLLLVELPLPHFIEPWDSYFEFGNYQDEQFCFVEALPENIRQSLIVRLHAEYQRHEWSEERRWRDRSPSTKVETGAVPIRSLIAQSRLVVYSYDSSGNLESLASNIPTMCFWQGGLDHLLPGERTHYELLRSAGILLDGPQQAANAVALQWDRVAEWWASKPVQEARSAFCSQYARTEKNPVQTLRRLLMQHETEVRNK